MDNIFARHISSWRLGEVAPAVFDGGQAIALFSIPLSSSWAVFRDRRFCGIEEEPLGKIVTPGGSLFLGDDIFSFVDATILKGEAGSQEVRDFLIKAKALGCVNVCLYPFFLPLAQDFFPHPATVISFPHGAETAKMKAEEIAACSQLGAGEFDVVANLSLIEDQDWKGLAQEFSTVSQATEKPIKMILETGLWDQERIKRSTEIAREAGLDYVKTSTGKNGSGASLEAVRLMSETDGIKIKASGGIRTRQEAQEYIDLGVSRIGASNLLAYLD